MLEESKGSNSSIMTLRDSAMFDCPCSGGLRTCVPGMRERVETPGWPRFDHTRLERLDDRESGAVRDHAAADPLVCTPSGERETVSRRQHAPSVPPMREPFVVAATVHRESAAPVVAMAREFEPSALSSAVLLGWLPCPDPGDSRSTAGPINETIPGDLLGRNLSSSTGLLKIRRTPPI